MMEDTERVEILISDSEKEDIGISEPQSKSIYNHGNLLIYVLLRL